MRTINQALFALNLGFFLSMFVGCDDTDDLREPTKPPIAVPPPIHGQAPDSGAQVELKPTITKLLPGERWRAPEGDVELVQSRLDMYPQMGNCTNFGPPPGPGWINIYRWPAPDAATYPTGQPNNCRLVPPQSHYPSLGKAGVLYPSGYWTHDNIQAFWGWVKPLQCIRVTVWEHADWQGGGTQLTYQYCNTSSQDQSLVATNLSTDAGFYFGASQLKVEWWAF